MVTSHSKEERINLKKEKLDEKIEFLRLKYLKKLNDESNKFNETHEDEIDQQVYYADRNKYYQDLLEKKVSQNKKKLSKYEKKLDKKEVNGIKKSKRIWEIDFLRGIIIWGMVWDHLMYDFTNFGLFKQLFNFGQSPIGEWFGRVTGYDFVLGQYTGTGVVTWASNYWNSDFRVTFRLLGVIVLVVLCGISSHLSKNNFKRGGLILGFGLVVTGALNGLGFFLKSSHQAGYEEYFILISTLTCLGLCIIIYNFVRWLYSLIERSIKKGCKSKNKNSYWKYFALGFAFLVFIPWGIMRMHYRDLSIDNLQSFYYAFNNHLPQYYNYADWVNFKGGDFWKYLFGFEGFGADWLGLFPFLGYIFLGGFIGETVYKHKKSFIFYFYPREVRENPNILETEPGKINAFINKWISPITYPGQHTLFVYIFHQPILIVIFAIIFLIGGASISLPF